MGGWCPAVVANKGLCRHRCSHLGNLRCIHGGTAGGGNQRCCQHRRRRRYTAVRRAGAAIKGIRRPAAEAIKGLRRNCRRHRGNLRRIHVGTAGGGLKHNGRGDQRTPPTSLPLPLHGCTMGGGNQREWAAAIKGLRRHHCLRRGNLHQQFPLISAAAVVPMERE